MNEKGLTLVEVLITLALASFIALAGLKLIDLQLEHNAQLLPSKFYDEITTIDKYIETMTNHPQGCTYTYTDNSLELSNENVKLLLSNTKDGVILSYSGNDIENPVNTKFNFIKTFRIYPIETVVVVGESSGRELLYRVPVKNTIQIFYNNEHPKDGVWIKEVVTYVLPQK